MPLQLLLWIKQMDTTRREWFIFSYNGNEKQGSTGYWLPCHPDASLLLLHHHHHNHHHHLNGHLLLQLLIAPPTSAALTPAYYCPWHSFYCSSFCSLLQLRPLFTVLLPINISTRTTATSSINNIYHSSLPLLCLLIPNFFGSKTISFSFSWNSNIKSLCRPKVKNLYNCLFLEFEMGWPKNCTFVIYVWDLAFFINCWQQLPGKLIFLEFKHQIMSMSKIIQLDVN